MPRWLGIVAGSSLEVVGIVLIRLGSTWYGFILVGLGIVCILYATSGQTEEADEEGELPYEGDKRAGEKRIMMGSAMMDMTEVEFIDLAVAEFFKSHGHLWDDFVDRMKEQYPEWFDPVIERETNALIERFVRETRGV